MEGKDSVLLSMLTSTKSLTSPDPHQAEISTTADDSQSSGSVNLLFTVLVPFFLKKKRCRFFKFNGIFLNLHSKSGSGISFEDHEDCGKFRC
jgi:hypothetical protein